MEAAVVGKSGEVKGGGEVAAARPRSGGWIFLGLFVPLPITVYLQSGTPAPLGERPEFYWTWALVASAQVICWFVSIREILWEDLWKSGQQSPKYFFGAWLANTGMMVSATLLPVFIPDMLGKWRLDTRALFGPSTLHFMEVFVGVGCAVGGAIVGIAGSQFHRLTQLHKPTSADFATLEEISARTKRSFMCLAILLTLAVFSTTRLYLAIRVSDPLHAAPTTSGPSPYAFLNEIVLHYGLFMSFLLGVFYLPVTLLYQAKAKAALDAKYDPKTIYDDDKRAKLDERERVKAALGLTAASGVEGLVGALGPVLTALLTWSSGK